MFTEADRLIFAFQDGAGPRRGDPLAIEEHYLDGLERADPATLKEQLASPIPAARSAASREFLGVIRAAFAVAEFDDRSGRGLPAAATFDLLERFWAWRDGVRSKWRQAAQHAAAYGRPGSESVSYEQFVGEVWNLERVQAIQAVQVSKGIAAILSGKPDEDLVDAMVGRESQVGRTAGLIEAARIEAEQVAKIRRGERF